MRAILAPGKYIQAPHALKQLAQHVEAYGSKGYAITDPYILEHYQTTLEESFHHTNQSLKLVAFKGECSKQEIDRLVQDLQKNNATVVLGVGGGKSIDAAKAVAFYAKLPIIIIPTTASTDAPCSALSVLYHEDGTFDQYLFLPANPNLILVDSAIIAQSPVRFTVAGMGDALATYYEARASSRSASNSIAGGLCSISALSLAKACRDTLFEDGLRAKIACEQHTTTLALENIIEANTFLSGMGFESGGLAAAHAIHNGLTLIPDCHHMLHGEKVSFGTLTQLILENAPEEEFLEVLRFCKSVGLPTNLHDLGVKKIDHDLLKKAAEASCVPGETIHNMPQPVNANDVYAAMLVTHQLSLAYEA